MASDLPEVIRTRKEIGDYYASLLEPSLTLLNNHPIKQALFEGAHVNSRIAHMWVLLLALTLTSSFAKGAPSKVSLETGSAFLHSTQNVDGSWGTATTGVVGQAAATIEAHHPLQTIAMFIVQGIGSSMATNPGQPLNVPIVTYNPLEACGYTWWPW